jgi:broad specificity phosphatase PhoE
MTASRTTLFLARHGSPENPDGVFYGHLDGFGLSATGRGQALGLGNYLHDFPVRRVYASPLQRAQETARLALRRLPDGVPVETRDDLLEAAFGKYIQGVPRAQVFFRRPLILVHWLRPGLLGFDETADQLNARIGRVCEEAVATCSGAAALLVSHADPIKAFWNRFLGRADWRFHGLRLGKGSFLELVYEDAELTAVSHHPALFGEEVHDSAR